jgi:serine phosphatase RsbU (regulator of sigma subunit)
MLIFIFIAAMAKTLSQLDGSLEYIFNTFYVVSIILISVNSLRVAWIAFLQKNQKIYLLIIAIVLGTLFGLNYALLFSTNVISSILNDFSPVLETFISLVMIYGAIYFGVIFFTALFHLPTAEAFDRKAEEVSSLMDLTKLITQVFDFKELAETISTITTRVCNSDAAWLVTIRNGSYNLDAVNNIGYLEADKIIGSLNLKDYENADSVQTINQSYFKIKIKNGIQKINYRSVAIAPLKIHSVTSGFLFTARKKDYAFDEDDIKAIGAFADYASVALENAKLIQESLEKERLEKELDVAREIQYKILPSETPKVENLDISALFVPAFEVGGDYYDFFRIGENKLAFTIADVSGKGISASFIMAEVKGIFETLATIIDNPKDLLIKANDVLKTTLERKSFVTAIYGVLDFKRGKLNFARVGHTPLHLLSNGEVKRLSPSGIGLGLDYGGKFSGSIKEMEIQLNNNDILLLYTDGVVESQNTDMDNFGYDRLDSILVRNSQKDIHHISNEIMREVSLFSRNSAQHDDITLLLFNWNFNNKVVGDN